LRSGRIWLAAAAALLGGGMALVALGVLAGALFLPGVTLVGLGLVVAAVGAGLATAPEADGV
jgi:hypothetical protein